MVGEAAGATRKKVGELRGLARECLRTDRTTEAFLHLSHALRLDEGNREVLLERSRVCSGEAAQYHFAMEDGRSLVEQEPESWAGHHRWGGGSSWYGMEWFCCCMVWYGHIWPYMVPQGRRGVPGYL